jgi:hypothetical protein
MKTLLVALVRVALAGSSVWQPLISIHDTNSCSIRLSDIQIALACTTADNKGMVYSYLLADLAKPRTDQDDIKN